MKSLFFLNNTVDMPLSAEQVFDRNFDIKPFPEPARGVAITDRVHVSAIELAEGCGLLPIDLCNADAPVALAELERYRVAAVLGRGEMDKVFKKQGENAFWDLRKREVEVIVRLGNGVGMDVQRAFDDGVMVLRTPWGNAQSVRIWQDLLLLVMYFGESDREFAARGNPAWSDNEQIKKEGRVKPFSWHREGVTEAVNPIPVRELPGMLPSIAERCVDILGDKKVAIIGGGGIIGREFIKESVFLRAANIMVYDPALNGESGDGFQVASTLEDALADADLVLLALAGDKEILGIKEFALLKRGAKVCSVAARGPCINPRALYEALESGQISGAGLDVHAAEKGEVAQFLDVPADPEASQPGHWAVLLRQHPRVIATNHSAASEAQAEEINAHDGIVAVHRYLTRGEISNALAVHRMAFPYEGFVYERDDGGFSPQNFQGPRLAMEVFHDGSIPGLIARTRASLSQVVSGDLQIVQSTLRNKVVRKRLNGVEMAVMDLPEAVCGQVDEKLLAELVRQGEAIRGVHRMKFFRVERK